LGTCVALNPADHAAIIAYCRAEGVEFVVVGPEAPLVAGLVDDLEAAGIAAFGPTKAAAQLEGSKGFTKDPLKRGAVGIPALRQLRIAGRDIHT
ncbi:phosphoribosylamine--glycine ligase, partial [Mycobacterium tuberculosis]|nr:phosphoribosylamine--glycine ligase [Mycobacterium tuberculosis]